MRKRITTKELEEEEKSWEQLENNPGFAIKGLKPKKVIYENIYFSVESCINKTFSYANNEQNEALY